ncbi:MAG: hypothetical protein FWB88_09295 [Defluviitaleaceae bacterium]|nr:hypothetical protein [Defluviitaleaceae bacterium]MCL2240176.1 hypothetical protein [Defluviitaleaceae bacterium]
MLTSVFYYNLYKPYIVSNANNRGGEHFSPRRSRIADKRDAPETSGPIFVLNKSLKNEVIRYARSVSHGVVDLRVATHRTANDMQDFNRTAHLEGWETAVGNLVENLTSFAHNYNRSAGFMQAQDHSAGLRAFSYEVADNVFYNRSRLEMLGLSLSENGHFTFDSEQVRAMSFEEVNVAIGENIEIFSGLQSFTQQLLSEPLVEHMRFQGLSYHYNYQRGQMETDGFSLLEMGMLVDRVV